MQNHMRMNGTAHIARRRYETKMQRLSIIKDAFLNEIDRYGYDVEYDTRVNFPEGFKMFTDEEIGYIKTYLGFEIEYHFGIFKARKIRTRDAKNNYELR